MFRYNNGQFKIASPATVILDGFTRKFTDLTREEWDELGYNEAIQIRREPFTTYETEWVKGDDLIYREEIVSSTVDEAAKFAALKAAKQVEITNGAESFLRTLAAEYPDMEMVTWGEQYEEAKAYTLDDTTSTPMLTSIATERGSTVDVLAASIVSNRAAWAIVSGKVVGRRLKYQDALDVADTVEEIEIIEVSYAFPA